MPAPALGAPAVIRVCAASWPAPAQGRPAPRAPSPPFHGGHIWGGNQGHRMAAREWALGSGWRMAHTGPAAALPCSTLLRPCPPRCPHPLCFAHQSLGPWLPALALSSGLRRPAGCLPACLPASRGCEHREEGAWAASSGPGRVPGTRRGPGWGQNGPQPRGGRGLPYPPFLPGPSASFVPLPEPPSLPRATWGRGRGALHCWPPVSVTAWNRTTLSIHVAKGLGAVSDPRWGPRDAGGGAGVRRVNLPSAPPSFPVASTGSWKTIGLGALAAPAPRNYSRLRHEPGRLGNGLCLQLRNLPGQQNRFQDGGGRGREGPSGGEGCGREICGGCGDRRPRAQPAPLPQARVGGSAWYGGAGEALEFIHPAV